MGRSYPCHKSFIGAGLKQITEAFELCSPLISDKVYLKNPSNNIHSVLVFLGLG